MALGADAAAGEGVVTGDMVNIVWAPPVAAPVDGILVGKTTYRARLGRDRLSGGRECTRQGQELPRFPSGKRVGLQPDEEEPDSSIPFVGRRRELAQLLDGLVHVAASGCRSSCRWSASRESEDAPRPRAGRCGRHRARVRRVAERPVSPVRRRRPVRSAGGDGTLRGRDQLERSDDEATAKLHAAVEALPGEVDVAWLESHLRPLVGLEGEPGKRREESFAAWRRYFEALAERQPLVLVFEDLHRADPAVLDFVDYLVDWASGVTLLVLCTARPELLERRPGWGGGKRNAITISLTPLSSEGDGRAGSRALLGQSQVPPEIAGPLLAARGRESALCRGVRPHAGRARLARRERTARGG